MVCSANIIGCKGTSRQVAVSVAHVSSEDKSSYYRTHTLKANLRTRLEQTAGQQIQFGGHCYRFTKMTPALKACFTAIEAVRFSVDTCGRMLHLITCPAEQGCSANTDIAATGSWFPGRIVTGDEVVKQYRDVGTKPTTDRIAYVSSSVYDGIEIKGTLITDGQSVYRITGKKTTDDPTVMPWLTLESTRYEVPTLPAQ